MKNTRKIYGVISIIAVTALAIAACKTEEIPVTGVSLDQSELSLIKGRPETLKAIIEPADATNKNVSWESSDTGVATVNSKGVVKGVAKGTATITVTTEDGGFTDTCNVIVKDTDDGDDSGGDYTIISQTTSGRLTITGLEGYNNMYVFCTASLDDDTGLFAANSFTSSAAEGGKISGGSVTLNVWKQDTDESQKKITFSNFNGNNQGIEFSVIIVNTQTITEKTNQSEIMAGNGKVTVNFSNGIGTGVFISDFGGGDNDIDMQVPTVVLDSPTAGTFMQRITEFSGRAADDYQLDTVWFCLSNYPDVELSGYHKMVRTETTERGESVLRKYWQITDTSGDSRNISWKFSIDTGMLDYNEKRIFPDGQLKIKLLVFDSVGKEAVTDEIVFYVKNDIPEITVDAPSIRQGTGKGDLGGCLLNYDHLNNLPELHPTEDKLQFLRVMDTKSMIVGKILDNMGIYLGPETSVKVDGNDVLLFPPQMRFWQVNMDDTPYTNKQGQVVTEHIYPAGYIPTLAEEPWKNLKQNENDVNGIGQLLQTGTGGRSLTFLHVLPDESGAYYAIQIRAQSIDRVRSFAQYPQSYINYDFANAQPNDPFVMENSYVLILVREP